jgi:hypothetical protein
VTMNLLTENPHHVDKVDDLSRQFIGVAMRKKLAKCIILFGGLAVLTFRDVRTAVSQAFMFTVQCVRTAAITVMETGF